MLNFDNIEELVLYMFDKSDNDDNLVSVIANKEMIIEIMNELLDYDNVILNSCDIDDDCDYNKEYRISLYDDVDSDYWYVNVEKDYDSKNGHYLGSDGYVLFHEDTNSKSFIDKQNNELMPLDDHDWFVVGEDIKEDDSDEDDSDEDNASDTNLSTKVKEVYCVNGKEVDKNTYLKMVDKINRDIDKDMNREFFDMFDMLYRPWLYEYRPRPIRFFW